MAGPQANLELDDFPHVVGEYNFLVVWRLCLPEWLFVWLKWSPFRHAAFRIRSSDSLFLLGQKTAKEAELWAGSEEVSTAYELLMKNAKGDRLGEQKREIFAEMAGQILAATETTSSALAFIFYYLARDPALVKALFEEL
jgi:cytochrome P450